MSSAAVVIGALRVNYSVRYCIYNDADTNAGNIIFESDVYTATVTEHSAVGTFITQVKAVAANQVRNLLPKKNNLLLYPDIRSMSSYVRGYIVSSFRPFVSLFMRPFVNFTSKFCVVKLLLIALISVAIFQTDPFHFWFK